MKDKVKKFINDYGTTISVSGTEYRVLMRLANSSELRNYLDDIEYLAVIKPAYFLTLPYDTNINENATFTLDNRNFIMRKFTKIYFENETLYKVCVSY